MNRPWFATSVLCGILSVVLLMGAGTPTNAAPYPFVDDFDGDFRTFCRDCLGEK